jgi:hypothetical protein
MPSFGLFSGEDKIGLFKSLKGLRGADLRYAVGYNMSTLRMLGVPLAGLVSMPYDIQQSLNTLKRLSQTVSQRSLVPSAQRVTTLGFARNVIPKARAMVPKTNFGVIDRYSSVYFGHASRRAIQAINRGGGKKAAIKAIFDPAAVDKEIMKQGMGQRHDNILHKWQLGTYMRAITGAPDPIRNNPFMQAKQYQEQNKNKRIPKLDSRFGILDSKGEHRLFNNARYDQILGGYDEAQSAFANESAIKGAMDDYMTDYMIDALQGNTEYLRMYNDRNQKMSDRDRKRMLVQTYRGMNVDESLNGGGNKYNFTSSTVRDLVIERDYENGANGMLMGYTTRELKAQRDALVNEIGVNALFDKQSINPQALKQGFTLGSVDPAFAKEVAELMSGMGLTATAALNDTMEQSITNLVSAITTIGQSESLNIKMAGQNAETMGNYGGPMQTRAIMKFIGKIDRLGYSETATQLMTLFGSEGFNQVAGNLGLSIAEQANAFSLASMKSPHAATPTSKPIPSDVKKLSELSYNQMVGPLANQRQTATAKVSEYLKEGGGIMRGKSSIHDYFFDPNALNADGTQVYDPMQNAMIRYLDDEGKRSRTQYYKSYGSLRYAENITQKRARSRAPMPHFDEIVKDFEDGTKGIITVAEQQAEYRRVQKQMVRDQLAAKRHGIYDYFYGLEDYKAQQRGGSSTYSDITGQLTSREGAPMQPHDPHLFASALLPGTKLPAPQSGSFGRDPFFGYKDSVSWRGANPYSDIETRKMGYAGKELRRSSLNRNMKRDRRRMRNYMLNTGARSRDLQKHQRRTRIKAGSDNYIPNKKEIAQGIHIVPPQRSKVALLQFSVVAGTRQAKLNQHPSKALRDIAAIEYGGPATDAAGGLSRRSDGMFYLPSFFFTRAAYETAQYLGMERGSHFTSNENTLGREISMQFTGRDNPAAAKLSQKEREKSRKFKEQVHSMGRLAMAQRSFSRFQRKNARQIEDKGVRLANKRALNQGKAMDAAGGIDEGGDVRYYDPEDLLMETTDRFLSESLAGFGQKEFKMTALGRAFRRTGNVGLGPQGFVLNTESVKQMFTEVAPKSSAPVYLFDNDDTFIPGRTPYIPVFDPQIYKQLLRINRNKAKSYLANSQSQIRSGNKMGFTAEYTRPPGDVIDFASHKIENALPGGVNTSILTGMLRGTASDVRGHMVRLMGGNSGGYIDYQAAVYSKPRSMTRLRDAFAGQTTQVDLNMHFRTEMKLRMAPILNNQNLTPAQKKLLSDEIDVYASGLATRTARGLRTVWSNNTIGGTFETPEKLFNAIERTVIILEQAMAYSLDQAGMFQFMMEKNTRGRLDFLKSMVSKRTATFVELRPNTLEQIADKRIVLEWSEGMSDPEYKKITKALDAERLLGMDEEYDVGKVLGGDVVNQEKIGYYKNDDYFVQEKMTIQGGDDMEVNILKLHNLLAGENGFELEELLDAQASMLTRSFGRYNTHVEAGQGTSFHAEVLRAYNERYGKMPDTSTDWNRSVINAQQRDGSGHYPDFSGPGKNDYNLNRSGVNKKGKPYNKRKIRDAIYKPVGQDARDWLYDIQTLTKKVRFEANLGTKTFAEQAMYTLLPMVNSNKIVFRGPNTYKSLNERTGAFNYRYRAVKQTDVGLVVGAYMDLLSSDNEAGDFLVHMVEHYLERRVRYDLEHQYKAADYNYKSTTAGGTTVEQLDNMEKILNMLIGGVGANSDDLLATYRFESQYGWAKGKKVSLSANQKKTLKEIALVYLEMFKMTQG